MELEILRKESSNEEFAAIRTENSLGLAFIKFSL